MTVRPLKITLLFLMPLALIGCSSSRPQVTPSAQVSLKSPQGLINYLKGHRLPTLRDAQVWHNSYGDGIILTTEHYKIYTTLLDPLILARVAGFVESAYAGYNSQLPLSLDTQNKFETYLFADRKQWADFTIALTGPQAKVYLQVKAGAYAHNGICVAYNIGRDRTFSVLGHEGWHQFNSRLFRYRLPSCLDEGIAMLFETFRYENGVYRFTSAENIYRLAELKKTLSDSKVIPLGQLIRLDPGQALRVEDSAAISAFYSQAYALVRFLREDNYGRRLNDYHDMLFGGVEGTWPISTEDCRIATNRNIPLTVNWNSRVGGAIFEEYIGSDYEQLQKEYISFCGKIVYHLRKRR
ncbi:MAG: hypothetical protein PHF37_03740 [Phycisphaerae bacterium]|nr:hypothetical protein [Phycisphaerae bacterium]